MTVLHVITTNTTTERKTFCMLWAHSTATARQQKMLIHAFLFSQHSSKAVGWETEGIWFKFLAGTDISPLHSVQTSYGVHPAYYTMYTGGGGGGGGSSPGVKGQGYESDHSPPPTAKVKNSRIIPTFPCMSSWCDAYVIKHKHIFNFTFSANQNMSGYQTLSLSTNEHRTLSLNTYCGVFTPCKNCNIETHSHDYATVDEAVFSPCWAEQSRHESCIVSPHLLPGNSHKHLDDARVGKGHVTASAVTQQLKRFPTCQIKGL
jgi:hypothetical protein